MPIYYVIHNALQPTLYSCCSTCFAIIHVLLHWFSFFTSWSYGLRMTFRVVHWDKVGWTLKFSPSFFVSEKNKSQLKVYNVGVGLIFWWWVPKFLLMGGRGARLGWWCVPLPLWTTLTFFTAFTFVLHSLLHFLAFCTAWQILWC